MALAGCGVFINNRPAFIPCNSLDAPVDMRCIPGGAFVRGSEWTSFDEESYARVLDEGPVEGITVNTFFMDTQGPAIISVSGAP